MKDYKMTIEQKIAFSLALKMCRGEEQEQQTAKEQLTLMIKNKII